MAEGEQSINLTHTILVLDTVRRMRDAESEGRREAFITHFDYACKLLIPYLAPDIKRDIEEDFRTLQEEEKTITKDEDRNEHSRKKDIQTLKYDFAQKHKAVLFNTLTKVGIVKINEEGIIEFTRNDIDTVAQTIRGGGGLPSSIYRAEESKKKKEAKNAK